MDPRDVGLITLSHIFLNYFMKWDKTGDRTSNTTLTGQPSGQRNYVGEGAGGFDLSR